MNLLITWDGVYAKVWGRVCRKLRVLFQVLVVDSEGNGVVNRTQRSLAGGSFENS